MRIECESHNTLYVSWWGIFSKIEPWKMGVHTSYFLEDPMIIWGRGFSVKIIGYDAWGKCHNSLNIKIDTQYLPPWGWNLFLWIQMSSDAFFYSDIQQWSKNCFFSWVAWWFWLGGNYNKEPVLSCTYVQQRLNLTNIKWFFHFGWQHVLFYLSC